MIYKLKLLNKDSYFCDGKKNQTVMQKKKIPSQKKNVF